MLKNIGANWMLTLLSILSAFILMPYTIRVLGSEEYGLWILVASATGYLSLLVLGTPMASVRFLSKSIAEKDYKKVNEIVGGFAGLYLMLGLLCLAVGASIYALLPVLFNVPAEHAESAQRALVIVVFSIAGGFIGRLPGAVFAAHQDFVVRNVILAAAIVLRLVLTLVLLDIAPSIITVAIIQLIHIMFEFLVSTYVMHRTYPEIHLSLRKFESSTLKEIFSFSIYVLILNLGIQLSYQTDALVIGAFREVSEITFYSVANSITIYYMEFIIAIAMVVMPNSTKLHTEGRMDDLRAMFLKWSKLSLALTMAGCLFLLIFGGKFLGWWIGSEFERDSGQVLFVLVLSFFFLLPARGVSMPLLMGIGNPRQPSLVFLALAVLNIIISVILIKPLGILGVALGTAIPNVMFAVYLVYKSCKLLGVSTGEYLKYVYLKALIAAIPVLLFLLWIRQTFQPENIFELIVTGVSSVVVLGLLWFVLVLRNDPYIELDLKRLLSRR
jgi:O-antigen/teichoic acid export membrane protein